MWHSCAHRMEQWTTKWLTHRVKANSLSISILLWVQTLHLLKNQQLCQTSDFLSQTQIRHNSSHPKCKACSKTSWICRRSRKPRLKWVSNCKCRDLQDREPCRMTIQYLWTTKETYLLEVWINFKAGLMELINSSIKTLGLVTTRHYKINNSISKRLTFRKCRITLTLWTQRPCLLLVRISTWISLNLQAMVSNMPKTLWDKQIVKILVPWTRCNRDCLMVML